MTIRTWTCACGAVVVYDEDDLPWPCPPLLCEACAAAADEAPLVDLVALAEDCMRRMSE